MATHKEIRSDMSIEETTDFYISMCYGDKLKCISGLYDSIEKYKKCANPDNPKVKERIKKYRSIIKIIKNDKK